MMAARPEVNKREARGSSAISVESGGNPAQFVPLMPAPHTLTGDIRRHDAFPSQILGNQRDVLVYLPPGYRRARARCPVLYLHDGQNCFDSATAYGGVDWRADETAERLILAGTIPPIIMVAVANAGEGRMHEYAPTPALFNTRDPNSRSKGIGPKYGRFLIEELKPFIDSHYRTRPEGEHTAMCGSSMGGLITLSLGLWYPKVFRHLAVCSPSIWWDDCVLYRMIDKLKRKPPMRIWLDMGTMETDWGRSRILRDCLTDKGWLIGEDLRYLEVPHGTHSEGAWADRFDQILTWLFPK